MLTAQAPLVFRRARSKTWAAGVLSAVLMASAQIALPLSADSAAGLTSITVVMFSLSTFLFAALTRGYEEIGRTFLLIFGVSLSVEALGAATGFPFGRYGYASTLEPKALGVPLIVPLAWFAMTLPAWEVAKVLIPARARYLRVVVGALALAAWDVFLDPQMTKAGYWRWTNPSSWPSWQGVPFSNYLGWIVIGVGLMALISLLERSTAEPNPKLILVYLWMAGAETLGFLLPFAFDRPVVGVVGGIAMVPLAVLALQRTRRPWLG